MTHQIKNFVEQSNALLQRTMPLTIMCRNSKLQAKAMEEISTWLEQVTKEKSAAKDLGEDDIANLLLAVGCALGSVLACIEMCLHLKNDRPHEAWRSFVHSQRCVRSAMTAHQGCSNMKGLSDFLNSIETQLFPPQVFTSIGASFSEAFCSICESGYGDCTHIAGRPYAGEFCSMVIRNSTVEEVSIVDYPEDKACIVTSMEGKNGQMIDCLSLLPTESSDQKKSVRNG